MMLVAICFGAVGGDSRTGRPLSNSADSIARLYGAAQIKIEQGAGRPPGLGLLPLLNQPGFRVLLDPDLPLMTSAPPGAARDPSSRTSGRSPHRHRPDRCRAHGSA